MITLTTGNLLESSADALINTVNCVGVMGKGIALQFKQAFPANFSAYAAACKAGDVQPGRMFITETGQLQPPRYIINFPTKRHWRNKSRLEDIDAGLVALSAEIERLGIRSIAVPPLGCGNGGLNWNDVRPRIEQTLAAFPDVDVHLYPPKGAPAPDKMPIAEKNLKMTPARALLVLLVQLYRTQDYRLTRLEIQKLAYFLQAAGQPLRLSYKKNQYGPYANNLNHILRKMEGQYLRGYGDGSQPAEIYPLPEAITVANAFLADDEVALAQLQRVQNLINGYETPYGMELLATVHWTMAENPTANTDEIIHHVQNWNNRKKQLYQPYHIQQATERLQQTAFVPAS